VKIGWNLGDEGGTLYIQIIGRRLTGYRQWHCSLRLLVMFFCYVYNCSGRTTKIVGHVWYNKDYCSLISFQCSMNKDTEPKIQVDSMAFLTLAPSPQHVARPSPDDLTTKPLRSVTPLKLLVHISGIELRMATELAASLIFHDLKDGAVVVFKWRGLAPRVNISILYRMRASS